MPHLAPPGSPNSLDPPANRCSDRLNPPTFAGPLCELASGTVVTPGQLVPWLTQAYVERAVFDGPNRVIELGQRTRFFTGGLRRAIEIRDRFCVEPGCHVPAEDCDIDHVHEYEDGGTTTQENAAARCGPQNRHKHKTKKANPTKAQPGAQRPPP
jgi:hypothetical protein